MKKQAKRDLLLSIISVILLIIIVVGVSYAVFTFSQMGSRNNTISTGTISFTYNEISNGISITNAIPMTDEAGKMIIANDAIDGINQGYFDFSVSGSMNGSEAIPYEVYGTLDPETTMDPNFVKIYLTDRGSTENPLEGYDGAVVPVYGSLPTSENDANGKRLYIDAFNETTLSKQFRLRIWVADNYTLADASKTFVMRVNVATTN